MISDQLQTVPMRRNLLTHSFYRRWVAGTLTMDELRDYSVQYGQVVRALPSILRTAAAGAPQHASELEAHAVEESGHVGLWSEFAHALGVSSEDLAGARPNPTTARLLQDCEELSLAGLGAAVAWALEVQTPAVSAEKLAGLQRFYGISPDDGGRYFAVHQTMDVEHASQLESMIATDPALAGRAPAAAERVTTGLWDLLTSVEDPRAAI